MITAAPKKISVIYFIDIVRRVVREAIDNGVFSRRHNNDCDEMFVFFRKKNLKTWDRVPVWRLMINFVRR